MNKLFSTSLFLLAVFCLTLKAQEDTATPTPNQVIQLFRHGARGVLSAYDESWPLNAWGVLTPVGYRQHYILGQVLGERYSQIFGPAYNYSSIYMISDTTPRCIQSAVTQLYGIYISAGPGLKQNYPTELAIPPFQDPNVKRIADSLPDASATAANFQPTIVDIVDSTNGYIFSGDSGEYCPNMNVWDMENYSDSEIDLAFEVWKDTIYNINLHLNESMQITSALDISELGDTFLADRYDNRSMPFGITDPVLIANMTYLFTFVTQHIWSGQLLQRQLAAYNPVAEWVFQLESYRKGHDYNTTAFYSGHDSNVLAVLSALGVVTPQCILDNFASFTANGTNAHPNCYFPFFASNLIVELFNDTSAPYVKFYYNNVLIPICSGQPTCPLDDFIFFVNNATGNNTLASFFEKCGASQEMVDALGINVKLAPELINSKGTIPESEVPIAQAIQSITVLAPAKESMKLEVIGCVVLALLCMMLLAKIYLDGRKYAKLESDMRREGALLRNPVVV